MKPAARTEVPPAPESLPAPGLVPVPVAPLAPRFREPQLSPAVLASVPWIEEAGRAIEARDYDRAAGLLERAISLEPNNGRAFYYYGVTVGERGNAASAIMLLRKAEILLQGDRRALGDVYTQMGINLERLGRRSEAIQRYEQALAEDPAHAGAQRRLQMLKASDLAPRRSGSLAR